MCEDNKENKNCEINGQYNRPKPEPGHAQIIIIVVFSLFVAVDKIKAEPENNDLQPE
jgi:hypothetical protein